MKKTVKEKSKVSSKTSKNSGVLPKEAFKKKKKK